MIRKLGWTICVVLLLWGCDRSNAAPLKPTVVRKKIVTPAHQTAVVNKTQPPAITKAAQAVKENAAAMQPVTEKIPVAAKLPTVPATGAGKQPLIDSETKVAPVQTVEIAPQKPTLKPKSDLTQIEAPIQIEGLPSGSDIQTTAGTGIGDDLIASTTVVAQTQKPLQSPQMYDPTDKVDPFQPLYKDQPVAERKKKERKRTPQTPLERIDLSQLKLVGIILASSGNRALVEEATGKGYVIRKGTYIGTNSGKVVKIDKDKIIVEEEFDDVLGNTKIREKELKLPKPPGEF